MEAFPYWQNLGAAMSLLSALPFVVLILLIAILPFFQAASGWWEKHLNKFKVALVCALGGILLYCIPTGDLHKIWMTYLEYAAFLAMLASLFVISGGIHISGAFAGFPHTNTIFLAVGAVLASLLGTTGASMIMIRPLLRANRPRRHKAHIVIFFIFIVSNCGGLLTPLGDPPLYLGFLRGVPFAWTLRLAPQWFLAVALLLFFFYMIDAWYFRREADHMHATLSGAIKQAARKIHVQGWINVLLLLGVMGVILASGYFIHPALARWRGELAAETTSKIFQIIMMGALASVSYRLTSARIHRENEFSFAPIGEVAILFFGIFGAMIPALALLEAKSRLLALREPWQFFWMSGGLSGVLDNAPTYLVYATLAASQNHLAAIHLGALADRFPALLAAISCGTVFFGAVTYIGNGPNFMVKSVAEHARVKMPSFGGFMLWSGAVLIPIFILQTFVFFR
ncbi:MAG: sodium:proton antiporter [Kiritimatiellia bacterium]|jgi:Na+/H+ antiporter NhaD/arsenite permease-like protein